MWFDLSSTSDPYLADRSRRVEVIDDHCDASTALRCSGDHAILGAAEPEALTFKEEPQAAE